MPVHYEIDRIRRVIRTKCVQNVALPEVIHHFHELEQTPTVRISWTWCSTGAR
jgi:hypothetical protein